LDERGQAAPLDADVVRAAAAELAGGGLRVLAMAVRRPHGGVLDARTLDGGFTLVGLQGMRDPIRPEAKEAVEAAHAAGIRVIMLTGDHVATAYAVGRELGLDEANAGAVEGSALNEVSDPELDLLARRVNIYA